MARQMTKIIQYREMVANWSPWGKPGNGAPNDDIRIRNLQMDGLYPVAKNVYTRNLFCIEGCS